ncbi:MAG: DUF3048 domain-containing protein [Anaerolineales bacterium]
MKLLIFYLIASLLLAGCSGFAVHPVAYAYQETPVAFSQQLLAESPTQTPNLPTPAPTALPTQGPPPTQTSLTAPAATPTETAYTYTYGPYYFPRDINPLTGLPVENQTLLERRPIVIKVTNFPRSVRPQWGLSLADHVFEYYIGDSMSRFIGIFYGKDASQVGPIRSARLFDEHVMRMYDGIFVFGWADDPVLEFFFAPDIKSHLVVERPDNCPPLCRIGPKGAYNNMYADTAQIGPYLADRGTNNERQNLSGLRFDVGVPKSGNPASKVFVDYSIVSYHYWEYDPINGRYVRFQETDDAPWGTEKQYAPLTDSLTGSQLSADNLVILLVPHDYYLKSNSTEILDQPMVGEGQGYAFRNSQVYPVTWSHDAPDKLIRMVLPDGNTYSLKPGSVWFEVIGESSRFEPLDEGVYGFTFNFP